MYSLVHKSRSDISILLVEDNTIDVEAIQRAFSRSQVNNPVTVAGDGLEALEILRKPADRGGIQRPFLILLDLNMPRMDGREFLQAIRGDPDLHDSIVFVLTTSKSDEDKVASYALNVAGYMVKSDIGEGFEDLVRMLDSYWRVVEFPPARA